MSATGQDNGALAAAIGEAACLSGWPRARVKSIKRLSGGASKESWAFDLVDHDGVTTPMVLRCQPADLRFTFTGLDSLASEARLLCVARAGGVPVPEMYFTLPEGSAAGEGYAMARIAGETVGARILKSPDLAAARPGIARQCGEILAHIHALETHALEARGITGLVSKSPQEELAALEARYHSNEECRPVFDYAFSWLRDNLPADDRRTLVHGDFRNGNLVIGPDGIRSVLDWELAHIGSPVSDLGWLCVNSWRFQKPENPVGGFGSREDMLAGYIAAGGAPVDPVALHAWEVFQTLFWGVMCAEVGKTFSDGVRSVEGAMIARRASETEFDLLRLLLPDHEAWNAG